MKFRRQLLRFGLTTLVPFGAIFLILYLLQFFARGFGDPICDWSLTVQSWEDRNADGIHQDGEPPLENIAISTTMTYGNNVDKIPGIGGTDQEGQLLLMDRPLGYCPREMKVAAYAPIGYIPTTPDPIEVTSQSTTSIGFGFRLPPGSTPIVARTGIAQCSDDSFRYSGAVTGAVVSSNGDIWITSGGGVTLRRGEKDYSQDIDYFGSYAADIAAAPDGSIWVAGGMRAGVAHFNGTSWKTYTTEYGALPSNDVSHVAVTRDGHVWALTSAGLADFNPVSGRWRNQSFLGNGFLLLSSPDGEMWLVDHDTLTRFQSQLPGDAVQRIQVKLDTVASVEIRNATVAPDGSVWLVGRADEWPMVAHYDPATEGWTNYTYLTTLGSMPLDIPNSIGVLPDGSALVALNTRGAIRLIPDTRPEDAIWMTYRTLQEYEQSGSISMLSIISQNEVWFSCGGFGHVLTCKIDD